MDTKPDKFDEWWDFEHNSGEFEIENDCDSTEEDSYDNPYED